MYSAMPCGSARKSRIARNASVSSTARPRSTPCSPTSTISAPGIPSTIGECVTAITCALCSPIACSCATSAICATADSPDSGSSSKYSASLANREVSSNTDSPCDRSPNSVTRVCVSPRRKYPAFARGPVRSVSAPNIGSWAPGLSTPHGPPSTLNPHARAIPSNSVDLPTPLPPVISVTGCVSGKPNSATCSTTGASRAHGGAFDGSTEMCWMNMGLILRRGQYVEVDNSMSIVAGQRLLACRGSKIRKSCDQQLSTSRYRPERSGQAP